MRHLQLWVCFGLCLVSSAMTAVGQQSAAAAAGAIVPPMVRFGGYLTDGRGKALTGTVGVTFYLYQEQTGGSPLWMETQNVQPDGNGHYSVMLGSTTSQGLPSDLFVSGEARWVGVQVEGLAEQARTMLLSVPYALKAADAETLGGQPASAFMAAASSNSLGTNSASGVSGKGKPGYVPLWQTATKLTDSNLFQNSSNVGLGTTSPAALFDVNGTADVRNTLTLFPNGSSPTLTVNGTAFNVSNTGLVNFVSGQTFPGAGTITGVTAGTDLTGGGTSGNVTLNLDTTKVPQLNTANTFNGNQTVNGTVSGTQLISTVGQGTAPLQVTSTTQVSNLNASFLDGLSASAFQVAGSYATLGANTFAATQTVSGGDVSIGSGNLDLPQTASKSGGVINLGGYPFIHACCSPYNAFVGIAAGNFTTTGTGNTAVGNSALASDTSGYSNSAFGSDTLSSDTTGAYDTAIGLGALYSNTTGNSNTASGFDALQNNTTGSYNVGVGYYAGDDTNFQATTGSNNTFVGYSANPGTQTALNNVTAIGASSRVTANNAAAIGANAEADSSNALVLGSINGVNGASANTNVGIGTTSPAYSLDVHGTGNFTGLVTFASGQTFPGTGTITGVTPGTDLTGGGTSGNVTLNVDTTKVMTGVVAGTDLTGGGSGGVQTLNLDTTKVPQLAAANTFTGNQTVNGNLSATGVVTGSSYQIGSNLFAFGSYLSANAFLGFAGNTTTQAGYNTAAGAGALLSDTGGSFNTASGYAALVFNTTGFNNTAAGADTLYKNTTGYNNTASGIIALAANTTGYNNTASGVNALPYNNTGYNNTASGYFSGVVADASWMTGSNNTAIASLSGFSTGSLNNATAIGANAEVAASNAMVLGSINGVNSATASTNVGIGTTAPTYLLHIGNSGGANYNQFLRVEGPTAAGTGGMAASFGGYGDFGIDAVGYKEGRFVVTEGGQVGIGTSAPDATLSVLGTADKVGGGSWGTYSDRRLKTLDGSFRSGLSQVLKLNPVRYRYKQENAIGIRDHDEHIGLVAQEVQKVIPEAVTENSRGYLLLNNDPIIWTMLNAIKEQQREITALREKSDGQPASAIKLASADMTNVYNGNVTTNKHGLAVVVLPADFEGLHRDFRYQLTVIGQFAQAIVAKKITNNRFVIRTNRPGVEVSWQVTAIHPDAAAGSVQNAALLKAETEQRRSQ